jgi:hypothetical protein
MPPNLRAASKIHLKERKERRDVDKLRDFFAISAFFAVKSLNLPAALTEIWSFDSSRGRDYT